MASSSQQAPVYAHVFKAMLYIPATSPLPYEFLKKAGLGANSPEFQERSGPMGLKFGSLPIASSKGTDLIYFWRLQQNAVKPHMANAIGKPYVQGAFFGAYLFDMQDPNGLDDFEAYAQVLTQTLPPEKLYLVGLSKKEQMGSPQSQQNGQIADALFKSKRLGAHALLSEKDIDDFYALLTEASNP